MEMIGNQCPGMALGFSLQHQAPQSTQKIIAIRIVAKNLTALNPPRYDMVQGIGSIYSRLPGHALFFVIPSISCNIRAFPLFS